MPVLVTAADQPLGRRIVARLLVEGGEVRAYAAGDGDLTGLRAAGVFVAVGDGDDEGRLEAAMADVHTVVHAAEQVLAPDADVLLTVAEAVATAASNASVRRLIALSVPGAGTDAADELRRTAGRAEQVLAASDVPTVVLRASLVDSPELRDALAAANLGPEERDRRVAPVRREDLVELVAAFDAVRSQAHAGHVVFAADGPEQLELGAYLERAGVAGGGLVGRVYRPAARIPLLAAALRGPLTTQDPTVFDAWEFTGLEPGRIGDVGG